MDGATTTTRPPPKSTLPLTDQTQSPADISSHTEYEDKISPSNSICNPINKPDLLALHEDMATTSNSITSESGLKPEPTLPIRRPHSETNANVTNMPRTPRSPRRPKVAFIVPPEPEVDQSFNKTTDSGVSTEALTVQQCESNKMSPSTIRSDEDPKTSPSVRFPGWGVITDDEEEEDDKKPQSIIEEKCPNFTTTQPIEVNYRCKFYKIN